MIRTMKESLSKHIANQNDNRLMSIALYEESKGLTKRTNPVTVLKRFRYFKNMVKRGSISIDELERRTYEKFGITEASKQFELPDLNKDFHYIMEEIKEEEVE